MNATRKQVVVGVLNQWLIKFEELDEDEVRKAIGNIMEDLKLVQNARAFSIR